MAPSGSPRELTRRRMRALRALPPGIAPRTKSGSTNTHVVDKRSLLPQITSALTALTAVLAILISWLTFNTNRDGQIAARYSNAIEQLGSAKLQTRLAALYSLGDIAKRSDYDRPVIMAILTGYVRQNIEMGDVGPAVCDTRKPSTPDVVTAMRLLFAGRESHHDRIDLSEACLLKADLSGTDMTCVSLDNSIIAYSTFIEVKLVGATMEHVKFIGGRFARADFTGSDAFDASFESSAPTKPDLKGAQLDDTDFSGSRLVGVDLAYADLSRTRLDGADLSESRLEGARLATYLRRVKHLPSGGDRSGELRSPLSSPSSAPSSACHDQPSASGLSDSLLSLNVPA